MLASRWPTRQAGQVCLVVSAPNCVEVGHSGLRAFLVLLSIVTVGIKLIFILFQLLINFCNFQDVVFSKGFLSIFYDKGMYPKRQQTV